VEAALRCLGGRVSDDNEFRAMADLRKLRRERFGVPCPKCASDQPRRQPTILLPGASCRVHSPPYRDTRPRLTDDEFNAAMADTGWTRETS
jgi:hypothetical protein